MHIANTVCAMHHLSDSLLRAAAPHPEQDAQLTNFLFII